MIEEEITLKMGKFDFFFFKKNIKRKKKQIKREHFGNSSEFFNNISALFVCQDSNRSTGFFMFQKQIEFLPFYFSLVGFEKFDRVIYQL